MKWHFLLFYMLPALATVHLREGWDRKEISTCFAGGEQGIRGDFTPAAWTQKSMDKVKAWVLEEYTAEKTGIHFTGFLHCEEDSKADVIIFFRKHSLKEVYLTSPYNGMALLGPWPGAVEGYPQAGGEVVLTSSSFRKSTVIHEFGHVAGLGHTHDHPDFEVHRGFCHVPKAEENERYVYDKFSFKSVMNYCYVNSSGLTASDRATLKKMYP